MKNNAFDEVLKMYKQAFSTWELFSESDDEVITHVSCHVLTMRELEASPATMKLIEACGGMDAVERQIDKVWEEEL